jgi:hypothetical protein
MKKIPVLDTIRFGYSFTFGHLGTIIGLIWLPMVLLTVGTYFVQMHYSGQFLASFEQGNPAAIGPAVLILLGWSLVSFLLYAMMYTVVTRQALGLRQGQAVIHFAFGLTEIHVLGALLGMIAIITLFLFAEALFGGIVGGIVSVAARGQPIVTLVVAVLVAVLLFGLVYMLIRLGFLLIPATVAESRVGLGRAWELAGGNFWRIVVVAFATLLPLLLLRVAAEMAVIGPAVFLQQVAALLHQAAAPNTDAAARMRESVERMREMSEHLPLLLVLNFLLAPLAIGLTMGPSAFAYRALTTQNDR